MPNAKKSSHLLQLQPGQSGIVAELNTSNRETIDRLEKIGLIKGEEVKYLRKSPFGDPIEIEVMNTRLCIRKSDAGLILLKRRKNV